MESGESKPARPRVFISYSHMDRDMLEPLKAQLIVLETAGLLDVWEDTRIDAGDKWYPEIETAMQSAAVAVCLVSKDFLTSDFCMKEEVPFLLERSAEMGMVLIPVLLSDCAWYAHGWLKQIQMLPGEGKSVRTHFADNWDEAFEKVAKTIFDKLNDPSYQPPKPTISWPELSPERVDLTRLPETGAALFGREVQLQLLDSAWSSAEKSASTATRVVVFTAHGGVGKSTLVNHWLADLCAENFRGATSAFGWSFYSQGARDQATASADLFVHTALRFFGDPDPTAGSAWERGERLARLVGEQRALLVLDGLEPLQSANAFDHGRMRDPALQTLLRGLALRAQGLCVVTTREPMPDLAGLSGVEVCDLEQISAQAGRALLRTARVVGTDAELEALSRRFGLHALAISLLGVYLYERDPTHGTGAANEIEKLPGDNPIDRVLAGFEEMLADSAELELLRLLGLFDRPADPGCLSALRTEPTILGLTERVVKLDAAAWQSALVRLEKLRLIRVQHRRMGQDDRDQSNIIDAHPLLREHFATQLRENRAEAWRDGHRRLFEYLKASVPYHPEGLDGLQRLYQAVAHGCSAGLQHEACANVYRDRILRRKENYSTFKLGAIGADLGAIACFFEQPWTRLSLNISEPDQAWLLNEAAFSLRALGRLTEALEPMRAGLEMRIKQEVWISAAIMASNLSELELTLGEVDSAIRDAEQSVTFADRSENTFQRMSKRTTHADALHQAGKTEQALERFREAEAMQSEREPQHPILYSLGGFRYCDLLLAQAERAAWALVLDERSKAENPKAALETCRAAAERASQTLKWEKAMRGAPILDFALHELTLGRAALFRAILEGFSVDPCHKPIEAAVSGLRASGYQDDLPRGLLTRAWIRFMTHDINGANTDLDEAQEIAERGSMKLHLADIHLHRARLFKDKSELAKAEDLIKSCNYGRRIPELEAAQTAARSW